MGSDRGRTLTVRAAVRGVIDFRKAKLRSVNWWRRTNLLLGELARLDEAEVVRASYQYHLALVANGSLSDDGFKAEQKKAQQAFNELLSCTHPWAERVRRQQRLDDAKYMKDLYLKVCGDPDDPLTVERWRQESAELEAALNAPDPTAATLAAVQKAMARKTDKPDAVSLD